VSRLKEKESEIEQEIHRALDDETLEKKVEESDQIVDGTVRSSLSLQNDLDEVRQKVDRYKSRREFSGAKEAEQKANAVAECYKLVLCLLNWIDTEFSCQITSNHAIGVLARSGRVQGFCRVNRKGDSQPLLATQLKLRTV
jgi:hypothetical protein